MAYLFEPVNTTNLFLKISDLYEGDTNFKTFEFQKVTFRSTGKYLQIFCCLLRKCELYLDRTRSKTFSFKRPWITTPPLPDIFHTFLRPCVAMYVHTFLIVLYKGGYNDIFKGYNFSFSISIKRLMCYYKDTYTELQIPGLLLFQNRLFRLICLLIKYHAAHYFLLFF